MTPSPIKVLADTLLLNIKYGDANQLPSPTEVQEELASIWLPIFRSKQNLAMALDALRITYLGKPMGDLCAYYLQAVEAPYENH